MFDLQDLIEELNSYELTVREQARTRENDPTLHYPRFFPDNPVDSVKLADIEIVDLRLIADRREWNADGRYIPTRKPKARQFEMVPMEAWFSIGEREIQDLGEMTNGDRARIIDAAKTRIPQRASSLSTSIIWGTEYESLLSWATGEIIVQNPQTGKTYAASMQIDSDRYVTDATPWTDSNAFDRLVNYAREARDFIGEISGVKVRQDIATKIARSAPRLTTEEIRMTLRQVNDYLSDELGTSFTIEIDERVAEKFDGSGVTTTDTKLWPANTLGFIPANQTIGNVNKAPQYRAQDIPQVVADFEGFDQRGIRFYYTAMNEGKALKVQAQANWLPIPTEQRTYVVNITQA